MAAGEEAQEMQELSTASSSSTPVVHPMELTRSLLVEQSGSGTNRHDGNGHGHHNGDGDDDMVSTTTFPGRSKSFHLAVVKTRRPDAAD